MTALIVRTRLARFSTVRDSRLLSERLASASVFTHPPVGRQTARAWRSLSGRKAA